MNGLVAKGNQQGILAGNGFASGKFFSKGRKRWRYWRIYSDGHSDWMPAGFFEQSQNH